MGLLAPAFLIGLGALAVPLLIHLIRRERHDAVEFPSLMFLSRIPQPIVKRRRIRNWWLFALRCLALILLVGAFSRPFVERAPAALSQEDAAREVVILLDRSYSMGYGDRWTRAVAAAAEAIEGLGRNDRASLTVFDAGASTLVQATSDRARLRSALDTVTVGSGVTRYTPALKLTQSILAASELAQREVVLISDFQRSGWEGATGAQLPAGTVVRPVHIGAADAPNIVVTHVSLNRSRVAGRERVTPVVHLANGGAAAGEVTITLEAGGREIQSAATSVPAEGTHAVALQPVTLENRAIRATIRAGTDALAADNAFHFVLEPAPGMRILIVEPTGREASLYLRRALELSEDPPFIIALKRAALPTAAELERTDVVVLNDVLPPEGDAGRRLVEWVRAGGGLVLAAGDRTATATWSAPAQELAGGASERVIDRVADGGARLGFLEYSHPVFELFRAPRAGGFGAARFYRYRPVPAAAAAAPGDSVAARSMVLARFDDGSAALVERGVGAGRVLVWGSTLDSYWTNLALEPVFLPLMHQIVKRAAGFTPPRQWSTAGEIVDLGAVDDGPLVVNTPGGGRIDVEAGNTLLTLQEQGFYEVREARAGGSTLREHAVNVDVSESDLTTVDAAELVSALTVAGVNAEPAARASVSAEEQEERQSLWWYMLIVVLALLTTEAVFANRRSIRPALR